LLTFYNEHHAQHRAKSTQLAQDVVSFEKPERVALVLNQLQRRGLGEIVTPHRAPLVSLERIHSPRYLHFLRSAWREWTAQDAGNADIDARAGSWPLRGMRIDVEPDSFIGCLGLYSMDATPLTAGTWNAAKTGADCAINAAHALRLGRRSSFALTRPPGHHAGADYFGGGCFLNNAALAAQHLLDDGMRRVAILDIDYHHGSGTQTIFYGRSDVLTISLHADPRLDFPFYLGHADETGSGEGSGYNMNLPLARAAWASAGAAQWLAALETACLKIGMFAPEAIVVSLGVGAGGGAHAAWTLDGADYLRIGERIAWLDLPTAFVFEGGAAALDSAIHTVNVLEGFETAATL
jgi:acetoin utilization deacetylase AcuC-like enzyme